MKKRGVVELQFNWIFVIIAGAVILLFFYNIASGQGALFQRLFYGEVLQDLNSIFISAEAARGTSSTMSIPPVNINFECGRYTIKDIPKANNNRIVFGPYDLETKNLIAWSYDWNVPYRVSNFLFITSPQVQYIFVNNGGQIGDDIDKFFSTLMEVLPKQLTKQKVKRVDDAKNENYQQVRFVFFDPFDSYDVESRTINKFKGYEDYEVSAIKIIDIPGNEFTDGDGMFRGRVQFYEKRKNRFVKVGQPVPLFGKASLFAAIFSNHRKIPAEDTLQYECIMGKALEKLSVVTQIYKLRTEALHDLYINRFPRDICYTHYGVDGFEGILNQAKRGYKDDIIQKIFDHGKTIQQQNTDAERQSCPYIY